MRIPFGTHLALAALLALSLAACTTPKQPPMPTGSMRLGVAHYTQPAGTADLLAGYMTEDVPAVDPKVLGELDLIFADVLRKETRRTYTPAAVSMECSRKLGDQTAGRQAALRRWSAVGRCMDVDLLVVPQMLEWRERDGSGVGVVAPAGVVMDTYVIDVNNETLISRSRYEETQSPLTDNLLETGKFLKRGAKWVPATELAREGMEKAVKELGL